MNKIKWLNIIWVLAVFFLGGCADVPVGREPPLPLQTPSGEAVPSRATEAPQVSAQSTATEAVVPTLEDMRAILDEIPYTGFRRDRYYEQAFGADAYPYVNDETGWKLADFISGIVWFNPINANEATTAFKLGAALLATERIQWVNEEDNYYHPKLSVLEEFDFPYGHFSYEVIPRKHVEATAKILFGDHTVITDETMTTDETIIAKYSDNRYMIYSEELDAFSITAFGAADMERAVILSYEDCGDIYEVTAVFLSYNGDSFIDSESMDTLSDEQLKEAADNGQKYLIRLGKRPDGDLYYISHTVHT